MELLLTVHMGAQQQATLRCRWLQVRPAAKLSTYPRHTHTQSETGHWHKQSHKAPLPRAAFSRTHIKHRQLRALPYLSLAGWDKKFASEGTYTLYYSGSQAHTHSWILWAPGMAPLPIHLPTCFMGRLLTGWSSPKVTAHSQHSHTCPSCTLNKQVPLGTSVWAPCLPETWPGPEAHWSGPKLTRERPRAALAHRAGEDPCSWRTVHSCWFPSS